MTGSYISEPNLPTCFFLSSHTDLLARAEISKRSSALVLSLNLQRSCPGILVVYFLDSFKSLLMLSISPPLTILIKITTHIPTRSSQLSRTPRFSFFERKEQFILFLLHSLHLPPQRKLCKGRIFSVY